MDTLYTNFNEEYMSTNNSCFDFHEMKHTIGLWMDGEFVWMNDLLSKEQVERRGLDIQANFTTALLNGCDVGKLVMHIHNDTNEEKGIKLYMQQEIYHQLSNHMAYYAPTDQYLVHALLKHVYVCNGAFQQKGIIQYTTKSQKKHTFPHLWENIKKGGLYYQPLSTKNVMSAFTLEGEIPPFSSVSASYWVIKSRSKEVASTLNKLLRKNRLEFI
ncbi:hypothetical protein [Priestia koreensis]|uniref:Uncharacterized protein n=1 Tax=Priestia koreensis TaxID=284581 RepID=A0A0M0KZ66_9BACI|nr:hypothetical protein [Priestia koreensis]KOO43917.1 hypothetical protein AMD01_14405 [Priestia koreensis]